MKYLLILSLSFIFFRCTLDLAKINYGEDVCQYCKMTIVDPAYSSRITTEKGKSYKFDSIECLYWEIKDNKEYNKRIIIEVADFDNRGDFIDAEDAVFIIDKKYTSPMGANLLAVRSLEKAKEHTEDTLSVFSWDRLVIVP